jgi:hypothetical protein
MRTLLKIIWKLLKFLFKIFLILLWGICRLGELILQQINIFLQHIITKPYNTKFR